MLVDEHVETARIFLDESDVLFDEGDVLQGSEKVWCAAAHAMMPSRNNGAGLTTATAV